MLHATKYGPPASRRHAPVLAGGTPAVHMDRMIVQQITIALDDDAAVSGLWLAPANARAAYVFAHGAGAGMAHKSMTAIAEGLAQRGIATLRYNFLYMERGSKRPDAPALAHQAVRAAVAQANALAPKLPLFAGGKSFGGRMTSQAQALDPLPNVRGLIFFAFPLHPAGKPGDERAKHLDDVSIPMLFLQGDNDALASLDLLKPVAKKLGERATLTLFDHADHSFHVPAKSGRKDPEVLAEILDTAANWMINPARP
ncbi:MAG: dienelactone hydrolase family protein [Hyphomonadaceae bacterium]|nr:dienelactone hydrolase family protein [Hyphomonadaceae bacterium]